MGSGWGDPELQCSEHSGKQKPWALHGPGYKEQGHREAGLAKGLPAPGSTGGALSCGNLGHKKHVVDFNYLLSAVATLAFVMM